ncbi:MAG: transcriptional repressor, partial [Chloroflexi bacterium]|nr:transcriptional repressor [Chloroflexota bacterium]
MTSRAILAQRLHEKGLRLTSQRLAVLSAIEEHPDHPDAASIAKA